MPAAWRRLPTSIMRRGPNRSTIVPMTKDAGMLSSEETDRLGTAIDKMLTRLTEHTSAAHLEA